MCFLLNFWALPATAAIGSSRYDIRGITELLRYVSTRCASNTLEIESIAKTIYPPPPPPIIPGLETGVLCSELSELETFRQSLLSTGLKHMTKIGPIEVDDSVCLELSEHATWRVCARCGEEVVLPSRAALCSV